MCSMVLGADSTGESVTGIAMPGTAYWMLVEVRELVGGAEDCTVNGLSDERTESARSEERVVWASAEEMMECAVSKT